jgi:hypothetical protein
MSSNGQHPRPRRLADLLAQLGPVLPGDQIGLGTGVPLTIRTALHGSENIGGSLTTWHWLFLEDGSLFEAAPKGCFHYPRHEEVPSGSDLFAELVAQDGALVRFERRVRAGTVGRRHIRVTLDGQTYRVAFTGTAALQRFGPSPELAAWRDLRPEPDQNVYFGLIQDADPRQVALGLWTSDVCLSFGERVEPGEVVVRRAES